VIIAPTTIYMLRFQILTLFPELFETFKKEGLMSRALEQKHIELSCTQLRDFAVNTHGQVDDTPYGGGSGMLLMAQPALEAIKKAKSDDANATVVLLTPRGKTFNQARAKKLLERCESSKGGLILLSPRYEGVDERVLDSIDEEISIGDFVLMGGEVAAMAVIETITRLIPGVLGNSSSIVEESFQENLLEYPQYTKPQDFNGEKVPDVLLSGNHGQIASWREQKRIDETVKRRPDLVTSKGRIKGDFSVALIHYPVMNKAGEVVTSSITSIDIHDIARSSKTFGASRLYIVHPTKALRRLSEKILEHWRTGYGASYNANRSEALETIKIVPEFDDVLTDIELRTGSLPKIITSSAKMDDDSTSYEKMRALLYTSNEPHLLLLGTGWGMAPELMERGNYRLFPINGPTDYNHLSVRAAAAIMLEKLFGQSN
jgi:tRNA (guanine37-N1)-methyltransferase